MNQRQSKRLLPLLEFGREREGIDLSKVVLTHHNLRNAGKRAMPLHEGDAPKIAPITEAGAGAVQDPEKARLAEIIEKLNGLFESDVTEKDRLSYVNTIRDKVLESKVLRQQASNNSEEQFIGSPDLDGTLTQACMEAFDAQSSLSAEMLNSPEKRRALLRLLLGTGLYEALRGAA